MMNELSRSINSLQERLATAGSVFSYEEIHEILKVMKGVQLKLIVANVPKHVFVSDIAREAFESLFKSFDNQSKFVYLPSFMRTQVYMTSPEATLCARLQTQGWRLPSSVLSQLDDSPTDPAGIAPGTGIACYIDQVDCSLEGDLEDNASLGSSVDEDEDDDDEDEGMADAFGGQRQECAYCLSRDIGGHTNDTVHIKLTKVDESSSAIAQTRPKSDLDHQSQSLKDPSTIRISMATSEGENTSEASGDDAACPSPSPLVARPNSPPLPQPPLQDSAEKRFLCRKHRRLERLQRSKRHLAPPQPSRLFLLSPPCSPPVGWQPKPESEPVINYDLLEALAALAPGEQFELHPSDEENRHPSIVITPCEHADSAVEGKHPRARIVQTRCPDRRS